LLSDPAVIIDGKGNFLMVNDAFEDVTGLSWKELIGNPFLKLNILSAESKAVLLENLKKRMQGAPVKPYEVCFTAKAGENRYVEVKGKKVSYAGQTANLVVFHDVTLRKENARRLKEYSDRMEALVEEKVKEIQDSEEKFRNLAENSPNMLFINQKGKVVYVNKEAEKAMGYRKEEFYSSEFNFLDLIPPENREFVLSNFAKHTKGEDISPYGYGLMTKDGRRIDAILNSKLIDYNGEQAILGIVTDITERKQMNRKLGEAEQRYHALFDQAPLGVLVIDPQTEKPVEFNDVAHTQLGYSREEFSKLCISDFEAKETADGISTRKAKMVREGGDEFETKHHTKNG
jgi:PAS domain S-box-containing protein